MAVSFGKVNRSASFNPTSAFPLDARYYFGSLAEAELAAAGAVEVGSADGTHFYGESVVVVTETDATLYVINPDKTLKQVGKVPLGDGKSISVAADGTISMLGFADADEGAQPRKKADGTIEWVVPSTDTVDGLQKTVAGLQSDVDAIEADYLKAADKTELEGKITTAQTDVDNLEKYVGTFEAVGEETTVIGYIDAKIGAIPEQTDYSVTVEESSPEGYAKAYTFKQLGNTVATVNIPKDMVVESGSVVTNPDADHVGTFIKLVLANANEDELFIDVGTLIEYITGGTAADGMITVSVDPTTHVATATINDGTVTLAKLATDVQTAIGKAHAHENAAVLEGITEEKVSTWDAAQPNAIETVDTAQFGLDENKNLTLLEIAMGKVTGLSDALAGKVDKAEGYRMITADEATKLEKLILGENGSVEVSGNIAAGNVDGLEDWITNRAGTLEGLSENNLTDTLLEKLNGIAEGAQVNVIDDVSEEFVITTDGKVLTLKAVAQEKVTGLTDALAGKVDKVEGKGLSTNDFTDTLLEKLNGIEAGAQVNYVKSVTSEFAVSDAGELSVASVNVNKLVQTEGEVLILNGGASA